MMRRKELFDLISTQLSDIYPEAEARAMTFVLFEELSGLCRHEVLLYPDADCPNIAELQNAAAELMNFKPLQYVIGRTWFCDMQFEVNENVLIPRPETEELVGLITAENRGAKGLKILDIGTGSGCIAVSLAKLMSSPAVTALDISPGAIDTARKNAVSNSAQVEFLTIDILMEKPLGKFNIIVSNPPYVLHSEKQAMRRNVLDFEPHTALFVESDDKLLFYNEIARYAKDALEPQGRLYFEINETCGPEVEALLREYGFEKIELLKDIFDKTRFARAEKPTAR